MNPDVLHDRYKMLCAGHSDIVDHLPTFVRTVEELGATKVIELGVRYGVSTIAWLYALEGRGNLWSVDCSFPVVDPETGVELLTSQGPLGVVDHWLFLLGYDNWDTVVAALPDEVDVVFIDSQHTYEQTHLELDLYYPKVRPGGRILLHDTMLYETANAVAPQPPYPVRTAMEEFCEAWGLRCENNPACNGLGTIFA
jgi:predicted O-methyltransferase YrrM